MNATRKSMTSWQRPMRSKLVTTSCDSYPCKLLEQSDGAFILAKTNESTSAIVFVRCIIYPNHDMRGWKQQTKGMTSWPQSRYSKFFTTLHDNYMGKLLEENEMVWLRYLPKMCLSFPILFIPCYLLHFTAKISSYCSKPKAHTCKPYTICKVGHVEAMQ